MCLELDEHLSPVLRPTNGDSPPRACELLCKLYRMNADAEMGEGRRKGGAISTRRPRWQGGGWMYCTKHQGIKTCEVYKSAAQWALEPLWAPSANRDRISNGHDSAGGTFHKYLPGLRVRNQGAARGGGIAHPGVILTNSPRV